MSTLGDNPDNGAASLGGYRAGGLAMRGGSARKGVVLYARPIAFSIVNGASDDKRQRDAAVYVAGPASPGGGGSRGGNAPREAR